MHEIVLLLSYPRDTLLIAPPIPLCPEDGAQVDTPVGRIAFYFDNWDTPVDNAIGPPVFLSDFFAHVFLEALPSSLSRRLESPSRDDLLGVVEILPDELAAIRNDLSVIRSTDLAEDRLSKERRHDELTAEHDKRVLASCEALFEEPEVMRFLEQLGDSLQDAVKRFTQVIRLNFGQHLVPDSPPVLTARGYWVLPGGERRDVEQKLMQRILSLRTWAHLGDYIDPLGPEDWSLISQQMNIKHKPGLSDVLLASAYSQCDPDMGNPRLALIEAVSALEAEVSALMYRRLSEYDISKSAVDRVLRETPLANMATVWIRREVDTPNERNKGVAS